jgi:hypothetical protein
LTVGVAGVADEQARLLASAALLARLTEPTTGAAAAAASAARGWRGWWTSPLLVVYVREHLYAPPVGYGIALAVIGVGAATGPLLLVRLIRDPTRPGWVFGPYAVRGGVDLTLATVTTLDGRPRRLRAGHLHRRGHLQLPTAGHRPRHRPRPRHGHLRPHLANRPARLPRHRRPHRRPVRHPRRLLLHGSVEPALAISLVTAAPYLLPIAVSLFFGLGRRRFNPRTVLLADSALRSAIFVGLGLLALAGACGCGRWLLPFSPARCCGCCRQAADGLSPRACSARTADWRSTV